MPTRDLVINSPFRNGLRPAFQHVPVGVTNALHPASQNSSTRRFLTHIYSAEKSYLFSESCAGLVLPGETPRQTNEFGTHVRVTAHWFSPGQWRSRFADRLLEQEAVSERARAVILSEANDLAFWQAKIFASLRMTMIWY
jgi:hypothetical protein